MRIYLSSAMFILLALLPTIVLAHDFEVDGIYYNINGNEATVTYQGSYSQYSNEYSGNVTIPKTVTYGGTTYSVTSIGSYAFDYCTSLTSITLPNSVTTIGYDAFEDCRALTNITIPNSVTSIGWRAFEGCSSLTSISVESGNQNYDSRNNCNAIIETATNTIIAGCMNTAIPNSVTSIGYGAFLGITSLTSITIPNSVTSIGDFAFDCTSLTSLDIPNSVTSIGEGAFAGCIGLTSVNIPNSVTEISYRAFWNCTGLTSVNIADIAAWCGIEFQGESNPLYYAHHLYLNGTEVTDLEIPNSVTHISFETFSGCSSLSSITIPNSVTFIGGQAFSGCSGLASITIPNSVISISSSSFSGCSGLTSITVESGNPNYDSRNDCNAIIETATNTLVAGCMNTIILNSVTAIGNYAFSGHTSLTSITIPNSVTSIGESAFSGCSGLTSITIPNSVTSIGWGAFYSCTGLTSITIPNSVTSIGNWAFPHCTGLTSVTCLATIPPVTYLNTFPSEITDQTTLYVPRASLTAYQTADYWENFSRIVEFNFEVDGIWYSAITDSTATVIQKPGEGDLYQGDVVIPDSVSYLDYTFAVTAIDEGAFEDCYELTSVVIGDAVETIGENAFQGCTGLTSVTIGSGVSSIGAKAFNYCNALQTVTCRGTVPPVMANVNCFSNAAYSRATLFVPRQQLEAYQGADYWYRFSNIEGWGSCGMGDVNADGKVSISDVTTLINIMLSGNGEYNADADLNYNGRMDIGDVATLIDYLLHM